MMDPFSSIGGDTEFFLKSPEYFAGWGTLSLINAGLAQGKNRSGFAWFLLSVFFGPIATFFLVLSSKLPNSS